jgi:hypothetical protein
LKSFLKKFSQYSKKLNRTKAKKSFVTNYSTIQLFNLSTIILILVINLILPAQAFEDYIITTKGKLTDISIEDNTIVDVYPFITVMNDKNTLFVSPLKIGKTRFCVLKNGKEKIMFNIEVQENNTIIDKVTGFDILALDTPEENSFELDEPPLLKEVQ